MTLVAAEQALSNENLVDKTFQAVDEFMPKLVKPLSELSKATGIPLSKSEVKARHPFKPMFLPSHVERDYEEALIRNHDYGHQAGLMMGAHTPLKEGGFKQTQKCVDDSIWAVVLGFVYGLQYNHRVPSPCYLGIRESLLALNAVVQNWYLVFVPTEWGTLMLSVSDCFTIASSVYGKCQIQKVIQMVPSYLTYQGLLDLTIRCAAGLNDLGLYWTKMT